MERKYNAIKISPADNVATVTLPIESGDTVCWLQDGAVAQIKAVTNVPQYHKISLSGIRSGEKVIKYGEIMAMATEDIPAGAHVHNHNVTSGVQS